MIKLGLIVTNIFTNIFVTNKRWDLPPRHKASLRPRIEYHRRSLAWTAQLTTSGSLDINDFATVVRLKHYSGVCLLLLSENVVQLRGNSAETNGSQRLHHR